MRNLLKKILSPPIFKDDENKTIAAELLNLVLLALYPLLALILIGLVVGNAPIAMVLIVLGLLVIFLALQVPMRRGFVKQASITLVVLITIALTIVIAVEGTVRVPSISFYILASVISGLLINSQAVFWSAALNSILVFILIWAENRNLLNQSDYAVSAQQGIIFASASILTAILLNLALTRLNQALARAQREKELSILNIDLEQRVEERTHELQITSEELQVRAAQLEAASEISQTIALTQNLDTLLPEITKSISERFDFYHTAIFLISKDEKFAQLKAANSEGGKRMLANKYQLEIGQIGVVERAAYNGQPCTALDNGQDAVYFDNPDLPETHSEIALPLKIGTKVIGVLDVQSKHKDVFSENDVDILTTLANQVAIAIENARQAEITQRALEEARAVSQQYIQQAWTKLSLTQEQKNYHYAEKELTSFPQGKAITKKKAIFSVPIQVHNETVGILKIHKSETMSELNTEDVELVQAVVERAALAMENARLLEDSQRRANKERVIGKLSASIGEVAQTDKIMSTVVGELQKILQAEEVSFELSN